ncbi:MAG: DUF4097 domain-containing protein [Dermatophilaceae bacterium]|nr:DUF4097 domain-containing protein [Intrasporangiaceae bacterium]
MTTATTTTRSQELTDIGALRLKNERGDVRIRCTTTDGTARVHLTAHGDVDLEPVELRNDEGTLVVDIPTLLEADGPPGFTFRLGPLSLGSMGQGSTAVDVEIELPGGADISARTKLGDISVAGEAGSVSARTGAGDLALENTGRVRLAAGSGDVSVRSCHGGDITTGAGDISVDEALGAELQCRAGAGAVLVRHDRTDKLSVVTGSGDITVHLAQGSLECRSGTGTVETVVPRGIPVWLDLTSGTGRVTKDVESVGAPDEGQPHLSVRVRTGVGNVDVHH